MCSSGRRIVQLAQDVVDKIAAGEVIVRPANAVKELIENSLDAGATEISVSIRSGGLELIKIQDNGHGICRDDLPIACCRFTTSKLSTFEDLRRIGTFGFRGEALASISVVGEVTITTRMAGDKCASKAKYKGGKLLEKVENSAGLEGTTICVEHLFRDMPARLAAFRQYNDEAHRISEIIVRYAIHYPKVSFAFRRLDRNGFDFRTTGNGDQHGAVRRLLHEKTWKELADLEFKDETLRFSVRACLSTPVAIFTSRAVQARHDRMKIFHLFINGRAVECVRLQRAFDSVFSVKDLLCPFVSFSLQIAPERVDVNMHPTKKLVRLLFEDQIIERVAQEMDKFLNENQTRQSFSLNDSIKESVVKIGFLEEEEGRKKKKTEEAEEERGRDKRKRKAAEEGNAEEFLPSPIILAARNSRLNNLALPKSKGSTTPFCAPSPKSSSNQIFRNSTLVKRPPVAPKIAPKDKIRVDYTNRSLDEFLLTNEDLSSRPNSEVHLLPLMDVTTEEEEEQQKNEFGGSAENPISLLDQMDEEEKTNSGGGDSPKCDQLNADNQSNVNRPLNLKTKCAPREFNFASLVDLRREICRKADKELVNVFKRHFFIGFFDTRNTLLQADSRVFIVRNDVVLRQFFYQLVIFSFGNMGAYNLVQSKGGPASFLPVRELLRMHFVDEEEEAEEEQENGEEEGAKKDDDTIERRIDRLCGVLLRHRNMLWNFFSLKIVQANQNANENGGSCSTKCSPILKSIPCLIHDYLPEMSALPLLLFRLARVDYANEKNCYFGVASALAEFHVPYMDWGEDDEEEEEEGKNAPRNAKNTKEATRKDDEQQQQQKVTTKNRHKIAQRAIRALIFPALRNRFLPSGELQKFVVPLTSTAQAFKHFGRC